MKVLLPLRILTPLTPERFSPMERRTNCFIQVRATAADFPTVTGQLRRKACRASFQREGRFHDRQACPKRRRRSARRSVQLSERTLFPGKAELRAGVRESAAAPGFRCPHYYPDGWTLLAGRDGHAQRSGTVRNDSDRGGRITVPIAARD